MYPHMGIFPHGMLAGAFRAGRIVTSTSWSRPAAPSAAALGAVLIATACTTVVDGSAHRPPGGPPPGIDVSLLATGNYPTRPAPPMGTAGTAFKGGMSEGARMAEHVVGPWEVDPALTQSAMPTTIFKDASALQQLLPDRIAAAAGKHNFVTGFSSARRTEPDRMSLFNAMLRFADPESAAAAAVEFGNLAVQPDVAGYLPTAQPVAVPNHPDTRASTYDTTQPGSPTPETNVNAYTPHGPFVLIQSAETHDGVDSTAAMVAKTLDRQIPAIDEFVPTAVSELADLAVDGSGLLARTIPETGDRVPVGRNLVYGPHAALHFQISPPTSADLFAETGMDLLAWGNPAVYRVRDGEAAAKMLEQFAVESQNSGGKPVASVPNMPDSRCMQLDTPLGSGVVCFAVADRYVIEGSSGQLTDAHQQTAAQYVMLMAS